MSAIINLIKIEATGKIKSFVIWNVVWIMMLSLMAVLFSSISKDSNVNNLMDIFPQEMMDSFGIQGDYLTNPESFLVGEFYKTYSLSIAVYALLLGYGIVGKRIINKTIAPYLTKSISRINFVLAGNFVSFAFFLFSNILIGFSTWLIFKIFNHYSFSLEYLQTLFVYTTLLSVFFVSVGSFFSVVATKSGQVTGVGLAVLLWFLGTISNINTYPEFAKNINPYNKIEASNILTYNLDSMSVLFFVIFTTLLLVLGVFKFNKMDINV